MAETTDRLPNGVAGDSYCLVLSYIAEPHGERELKSAGFYLVTIPAYSRVPDDNQLLKLQVIQFQQDENDHRQDYINLYRQAFTTVGDLAAVNTAQLKIKGWVVTARYFAEIIKPAFGWAEEDKNDEDRNKEFDNPEYRYVELQPPLEQQLLDRVNKILRSQAGFVSLTKDD
ncbi:MAG: hypothetical protein M1829_001534 [Trizodia sp. TS-e1964]|nr:MAG: hypothetical protein M1829_001534 [Trizodia sp. TS-e1964]